MGKDTPAFDGGLFTIDDKEKKIETFIPRITVKAKRRTYVEPMDVFKAFQEPDAVFNITDAEKAQQRQASLVLWSRDYIILVAPNALAEGGAEVEDCLPPQ